jgi:multiple sugar transport system substrate-binding protein
MSRRSMVPLLEADSKQGGRGSCRAECCLKRGSAGASPSRYAVLKPLLVFFALGLGIGCEQDSGETKTSLVKPHPAGDVDAPPLQLVVVNDSALADAARREWTARAARALEVINIDVAALRAALVNGDPALMRADAIIFPPELLGELADHEWLQPIPGFVIDDPTFATGDLAFDDVFPLPRQSYVRWGDSHFAIPIGARVFTLGFRADVIEALSLARPSSLLQLQTAIKTFEQAPSALNRWPDYALAQPLAESWAARVLLAYAAPLCSERGRYSTLFNLRTMDPLIESPGFQRALEWLIAGTGGDAQNSLDMGPTDSFAALFAGKCLFAIGWPETHGDLQSDLIDVIRIVEFPGATETYSRNDSEWKSNDEIRHIPLAFPAGRLGAALRHSRRQKPAWNLIVRLGGVEWGSLVCAASEATGPVRASQLGDWLRHIPAGLGYQDALISTSDRGRGLVMLRIPGATEYLAALDAATRAAAKGQIEPAEALAQTARQWADITSHRGTESQIGAYCRNLGLEP